MSNKAGPKGKQDGELNVAEKGEAKPPRNIPPGSGGNMSRRAKKKINEQQKQPKAGSARTTFADEVEGETSTMGTSKRYQQSRQHSATQKRERNRKVLEGFNDSIIRGGFEGSSSEQQFTNLPEDMRISRLLRRLASEQSVRGCKELCDLLEVAVSDPSNATYVRKSFELLSNSILPILESAPCRNRVAQLLGIMLYVMVHESRDLTPFRNWINKWLWHTVRLRTVMLVALHQALKMDREYDLHMEPAIHDLLGDLQELLEETDNVEVFMGVTEVIVEISRGYPVRFEQYFNDVVDIVVGWQLETVQSPQVKLHCARVLQAFKLYWQAQRETTRNLLEQFVEDIEGCWDDADIDDREQWNATCQLSATLLTAFNSVFKCLHEDMPESTPLPRIPLGGEFKLAADDHELFESASARIMVILSSLIHSPAPELPIAAISDFFMLRLSLKSSTNRHSEILSFIETFLEHIAEYNNEQVGSLLHLLLRFIETDNSDQQMHTMALLPLLMTNDNGKGSNSGGFYTVRFRRSIDIQQAVLLLYHRILSYKNVSLLQRAYELALDDLDQALSCLRLYASDHLSVGANVEQTQSRISFNLRVLSPLVMARNSIFITWTLQDKPILHVLLERLALLDSKLWVSYGNLHHAAILVAYQHCAANNNFISSSNLLQTKSYGGTVDRFLRLQDNQEASNGDNPSTLSMPKSSPTADHFGLVLRFLGTILAEWTDTAETMVTSSEDDGAMHGPASRNDLLELLLDWCLAIVMQTERYYDVLQECSDFNRLLTLICTISVDRGSSVENIGLRCADCLDAVCQYSSLHPAVYQTIAEACCVHLCSVYGSLRTRYTVIFSRLPLRHSLRQVNAFTGANRRRREEIRELKNVLYQSTSTELRHQQSAVLRMADLRPLFNRIAFSRDSRPYVGEFLHELLTRSYNQPSAYGEMALRDLRCLIPWAQWEAAQLCVNHKLRTPFGKPQQTFLYIESIVKQCARILALTDKFTVHDTRTSITNQRHARIMLGFLEALEKSIYNAAVGTAYALPAPEKPVRTFFRVNAPTCAEWFTRIRTAVDLVALHCMEPEMVIRYSEAVLHELVSAGKTTEPIFEHMLMSLVWALVRNWESDALYGVYVWSKQLTGRKYTWIRMAAEEAAGHRETAAEGFRAILGDPSCTLMDNHIRDFIVDQTIISLLFTGDYRQLYEFLRTEEANKTPRVTIPMITVTAEQIYSIIRFEETLNVADFDMAQWELVDVGNDIPNDFSCHKMICRVENSLSGIILQEQIEQRERMIDVSSELIQCYLQECLLTKCHEYLFQLTITNHILYKIAQRTRQATVAATAAGAQILEVGEAISGPLKYNDGIGTLSVEKFYGTLTLMRLLAWSEFLLAHGSSGTSGYEGEQQNIDLRLDMVSSGRKEKNYALCRRELEKYYHKSNLAQRVSSLGNCSKPTLEQVSAALMEAAHDQPDSANDSTCTVSVTALWGNENHSRAIYEHCKWMYCQPGMRLEAIDFAASATYAIDSALMGGNVVSPIGRLAERTARFMLTLSDWLSNASSGPESGDLSIATLQLASLQRLGGRLAAIDAKPLAPDHAALLGAADAVVGSLLQGAANRCPSLAKAWFHLGSWLYRWGKRVVELSGGASRVRICVEQVADLLTDPHITKVDCERIAAILNEHEPGRTGDDSGVIGEDGTDDAELDLDNSTTIGSIGLLEALKGALPELTGYIPPDRFHAIIDVWRSNHRAVYGYYEAAASAYFRFLQLSTQSPHASGPVDDGTDSERTRSVTVTLRLLRLIVKHALGLKEVLEEGLATTPSDPWRVITPQLFSRLAHHEPYVRRRVSELLCRVAKDAPHLIIFPAVVGSVHEEQPELNSVVNVLLEGSTASSSDEPDAQNNGLASCFNALLDILSREVPDTVKQVQTLVHELRRISLLWEELWLVSMQQLYADYNKRVAAFESEYSRLHAAGQLTEQRRALLTEKHRLLLWPLIFTLEQLYSITARTTETNHERHFHERYHRYIRLMLDKLRAPADFSRPIEGWERFRAFYTQLQTRSQKRFSLYLRLADVSPKLQQLAHTAIAMPGIDTTTVSTGRSGRCADRVPGSDGQSICIRAVDGNIQILPTKTRPKKLVFHGNDGRRYGYLSKGLEDLHLDERIMQFLSIANLMMTRSIDCNGNVTHYRAEHYSVIPLGPRSGLITWVDNTVPIFSLYKKWQQREALQQKEAKETGGGGGGRASVVLRPTEQYYKKLNPLLQSYGLKSSDSRRDWPLAALKQVLTELQQETPRDLLAKELWCHSATASSWRQVVRTYSHSLAVMSVIGYIIGLGDRHLDNILVKLATGDIVHIDYNVCFEKGKTLRVPERVPFRMTPNLEEALGLTGIEGSFRCTCEHVLKSLKKGRETLLTLLEAFVYDPLVDWAISEEAAGGGLPMTATEITVSTMTAATAGATSLVGPSGTTSSVAGTLSSTSGVASRYISLAKQQLDREVTRDTLAVRFAECRVDWQANRDELLQLLISLQKLLSDQRMVRAELREAEQLRTSLSQQLQLIGEAEYLDTAFGSHPLASLSQRLCARARMQEEYATMRDHLAKQATQLQQHLVKYDEFQKAFRRDRLACVRWDIAKARWALPKHSPQMITLLTAQYDEKSCLTETYVRYSTDQTELNRLKQSATTIGEKILQLLEQYGELMEESKLGTTAGSTLVRYISWYTRLAEADQDASVALTTMQEILREQQETRSAIQPPTDHQSRTNPACEHPPPFQRYSALFDVRSMVCTSKVHPDDIETELESLLELAIDSVGFFSGDNRMNLLVYFANARTIIELNHSLLKVESSLFSTTDNWLHMHQAAALARHIRLQCDRLVQRKRLPDTSLLTATTRMMELNVAITEYENLERFNDRLLLDAFIANPENPEEYSGAGALQTNQLLWRAIKQALRKEHCHLLLNEWIEPTVEQLIQLLAGAADYISSNQPPLPPESPVDQINQAIQLQQQERISYLATVQEQEKQRVAELVAFVKRAAIDGSTEEVWLALLPVRRVIVDVMMRQLVGRVVYIAAGLVYENLPGATDSGSETDQRMQLANLCRTHCAIALAKNQRLIEEKQQQLEHLEKEACRYNEMLLMGAKASTEMMYTTDETPHDGSAEGVFGLRRTEFVQQLHENIEAMKTVQSQLNHAFNQMISSTELLRNRFGWAASAYPPLCSKERIEAFELTTVWYIDLIGACIGGWENLVCLAAAVLVIEESRIDRDDGVLAQEFKSWSERWQKLLPQYGLRTAFVSATEEALVELLDPEGMIDHTWISNVRALIDDMTDQALTHIAQLEQENRSVQGALQVSGGKLALLTQAHKTIAGDIRALLRTQLRIDGSQALRDYLQRYRRFLDLLQEVRDELSLAHGARPKQQQQQSDSATESIDNIQQDPPATDSIHAKVDELIALLPNVFEQLFTFERPELANETQDEDGDPPGTSRQRAIDSPTFVGSHVAQHGQDKNQKQREQKRNAHAVSVWRRIRMKLEGRDPDPNRRCSVPEQVNWMIQEAMNADNLAVLYEGWTPWV